MYKVIRYMGQEEVFAVLHTGTSRTIFVGNRMYCESLVNKLNEKEYSR